MKSLPRPGYTPGMKTAVSIPDALFAQAEDLAQRLGKSRSQVYREALAEYVARREPGAVTAALNQVADDVARDGVDEWLAAAAQGTLGRSEW